MVIQSSYLANSTESHDWFDVDHDPTQPSDAEICVYGQIGAAQRARHCWISRVVDLTSPEYPPGVEQACRQHTQERGWEEELDEKVLLRDISVSIFVESSNLANSISHKFQQAPGNRRSIFWQNYVILCLLLHADHASEGVQTTLAINEEDLLDTLRSAISCSKIPARPKRERAQITSLLRALYTTAGGDINHLYQVSGKYSASENRDLLGSIFGTRARIDFENYDVEKMRQRLSKSPMFSNVTLSAQNLEVLITQIRGCLYLGYPPSHLDVPPHVLSGLSTEQVNMFTAFRFSTYQQIPALAQDKNNILMLLIWGQQMGSQNCEALQQWLDSEDASKLYDGLLKDVQTEQPLEQLVITMAALVSFHRWHPDYDDDTLELTYGSFLADMHACVTGLRLENSGKVMERVVFSLIRVVQEQQFEDLAIFLATTLDRDQPALHYLDGLTDEYFRWRTAGHSHMKGMKMAYGRLFTLQLCPLLDSLSISTDPTGAVSRYFLRSPSPKLAHVRRLGECFTSANPAQWHDSVLDCYKYVRIRGIISTDATILVSLLRSKFKDLQIPSIERLSDGSWEIVVRKATAPLVADVIRGRFPASDIDMFHNPLEPTTEDLDGWTHVNAARLNCHWYIGRALRIIGNGMMVNGMTLAARIYLYHLSKLIHRFGLDQHAP
ncbi:uncharacterized protein HMPREF1541_10420 [Cyphellophora europaea CBS 101466]|uniref:Uncharacterized protein n=1 Tax=Cyphellophora europaea (strain CBS 101466) TaxID=1220924 RepID=W2S7Z3_CYPE1|nr:uncharacterized protein HMPREF1541_10420 [Cyphellophora europaea CBS 101466]ETN44750.1 hypothetical protein HMPREF1541_10420 [Cyphellophora europaea CBS 101466]